MFASVIMPEQFEAEMRRCPGALRSEVELARVGLGVGNQNPGVVLIGADGLTTTTKGV